MDKALDQLERVVLPPTITTVRSITTSPRPPFASTKNAFQVGTEKATYTPPRTKLVDVLMGLSPPSPPTKLPETLEFFDASLNDSQRAAIRFALSAPEVACIHGPPGALPLLSAQVAR
jgi:hypothetical protein